MFFLLKFPIYTINIWQFIEYSNSNYTIFIHIHTFYTTIRKMNNFLSTMLNYKLKLYNILTTKYSKPISLIQKSNKKQRPQKGLGKARIGSLKSSISKGGGVIFGPRPRLSNLKINNKEWVYVYKSFLINKRCNIFWIYINKSLIYYIQENFIKNFIHHLGLNINEGIIFSTFNKNLYYKKNFSIKSFFYNINLLNFLNYKYIIYML